MPDVAVHGCRIHYNIAGSGPALVLLAGLAQHSEDWAELLPELSRRNTCVTIDHRGTGRSSRPRGFYSARTLARDVIAVLDDAGIRRAHILGNSLGGIIAQKVARLHPERVVSLILLETSPGFLSAPPSPRVVLESMRWIFRWVRQRPAAAIPVLELPESPPPRALRRPQLIRQALIAWTHAGVLDLRHVRTPTLVIHGRDDAIIPCVNARIMRRVLPDSRLVLVPRAGHFILTDNLGAVRRALHTFLSHADTQSAEG